MTKRYLMWTLGTFFLSTFIFTFVPVSLYFYIAGAVALLLVPAILLRYPIKKTVLSCMLASLLALLLFFVSNQTVKKVESQLINNEVYISGEIAETDMNSAGTLARYKVHINVVGKEKLSLYHRFYIYLYSDGKDHQPGERISATVEFFETPIEFGYGREDRIFIAGYQNSEAIKFSPPAEFSVYETLNGFRQSVVSKLQYGNDKTIGLLKALCFGDKNSIDSDLFVSLRRIGLSHVMAVSGLHLSFAVLLFSFAFLVTGVHYRIRHIIGVFISLVFTISVGMPLSCLRACVMLCIFSIGMAFDWFSDSLTSLSLAAFLVLLFNPYAVRDIGFLLSLSATFGIITLQGPIENFLFPKKIGKNHRIIGIYRKFTGIFSCSVAAMIATFPITIIVFRYISWIGPFANMILIYPLQLLFMLGILTVVLSWVPGIGMILGFLCDLLYAVVDEIAQFLGRLSFANVSSIDWFGLILLSLFIIVVAVSLYLFIRNKHRVFIPLFTLFLCFSIVFNGIYIRLKPDDPVKIAFIDVGQGDCTVVSKGNRAVVFDYGGSSSHRYNLIEYMHSNSIDTVELLALTHLHNDHTNGIKTLIHNLYIENIIYPPFDYDSVEIMSAISTQNNQQITQNDKITVLDDVTIEIMADALNEKGATDANERCICYRVEYGATKVLITGDLSGTAEMELLGNDLSCTILKVGHHGSNTSSFYPFLKKTAPEIAVISVGENSYGLPKKDVINRISTICPNTMITMIEGTVCYQTDGLLLERINQ